MITEEKWTVDDVHVQRGRVAVITYVEDFDWQIFGKSLALN